MRRAAPPGYATRALSRDHVGLTASSSTRISVIEFITLAGLNFRAATASIQVRVRSFERPP